MPSNYSTIVQVHKIIHCTNDVILLQDKVVLIDLILLTIYINTQLRTSSNAPIYTAVESPIQCSSHIAEGNVQRIAVNNCVLIG